VRQRPGGGKAIFVTLEDETGIVNCVIWARVFERYRRIVMGARIMKVRGRLQKQEGVTHVVAEQMEDWTDLLGELMGPDPAEMRPIPAQSRAGGHPRNQRIMPSSRDFH
jgi:error-prone DNA polymerase